MEVGAGEREAAGRGSSRPSRTRPPRDDALEVLGKGVAFFGSSVVEERAMNRATVVAWQTETVNQLTPLVGVVDACRLVGRPGPLTTATPTPPRVHGPHRKRHSIPPS